MSSWRNANSAVPFVFSSKMNCASMARLSAASAAATGNRATSAKSFAWKRRPIAAAWMSTARASGGSPFSRSMTVARRVGQRLSRSDFAALHDRLEQLFGEEGIAFRRLADGDDLLFGPFPRAERVIEQLVHLCVRQRFEFDSKDRRVALELPQHGTQQVVLARLVRAAGYDDQESRAAHVGQEVEQEFERGTVGPVDILQHEHGAAAIAKTLERFRHRVELPKFIAFAALRAIADFRDEMR